MAHLLLLTISFQRKMKLSSMRDIKTLSICLIAQLAEFRIKHCKADWWIDFAICCGFLQASNQLDSLCWPIFGLFCSLCYIEDLYIWLVHNCVLLKPVNSTAYFFMAELQTIWLQVIWGIPEMRTPWLVFLITFIISTINYIL